MQQQGEETRVGWDEGNITCLRYTHTQDMIAQVLGIRVKKKMQYSRCSDVTSLIGPFFF